MEHPDYKYQPRRKKSKGLSSTTSSSTNTPQSSRQTHNNNNNKTSRTIQNQNIAYTSHEYNNMTSSPNQMDDLQTIPAMHQQSDGQLQSIIKSEMMYQNQVTSYNYNSPIFQSTANSHSTSDYSSRNSRHQQYTDLDSRCSSTQSDNSENESHPLTPPATPYTTSSHHIATAAPHLISTASPHNRNSSPSSSSSTGGIKDLHIKSQIYIDTVTQPKSERYQTSYYDPDSHRYYSHQLQSHQFLTLPSSSSVTSSYNIHGAASHHHNHHQHHLQQQQQQHQNHHHQPPSHSLQTDNNTFTQQIEASIEADVDPKELEQYLEPPTNIEHVRKLSNPYLASTLHFKEQNNFIELQPTTTNSGLIQNYDGSIVERGDNNIIASGVVSDDRCGSGGGGGENGDGMVTDIPNDNATNAYYSHDAMAYQYHSHNWNGSHPL